LTSDICGLVGKLKDCLVLSIATGKHGAPWLITFNTYVLNWEINK
jgi:hypothetical protein